MSILSNASVFSVPLSATDDGPAGRAGEVSDGESKPEPPSLRFLAKYQLDPSDA